MDASVSGGAGIILTEDQERAKREIEASIEMRRRHLLTGSAGTGKEQPVSCLVQTPNGPRRIGDLQPGDWVFSVDGMPTMVEGVYPQGVKPVYRVTFRDGSSTRCGRDHLWAVKRSSKPKFFVRALDDLMDAGIIANNGDMKFRIPLCLPVQYPFAELEIDPYVLGVLIGDGYLGGHGVVFSVPDIDSMIVDEVGRRIPKGYTITRDATPICPRYLIRDDTQRGNGIGEALRRMGLRVKSGEKSIPEIYKRAAVGQRLDLLRGLMDTDGTSRGNRICFSTTSETLADDIVELIQSLGGTGIKFGYHRERENGTEYTEWNINVKMEICPFSLPRKADGWSASDKNPPSRYIRKIEREEPEEQVCIKVRASDGLYLTDAYIVTHNTTLVQIIAREASARGVDVRLAAPTHKAAGVLRAKLGLQCGTIHSLLKLRPKTDRDKQVFVRSANAKPVEGTLFILDECSMLGEELMKHVRRWLDGKAVIFVGDPAQIPPVGEDHSESFDVVPASHLTTVVRQAAGNPIIAAAQAIRLTQDDPDAPMDWSWCAPVRVGDLGVFVPPRGQIDAWMKKAFLSDDFADDPDFSRYLCHTNDRVLQVNTRVRVWKYGEDAKRSPFLPGEMLLMRSPLVIDDTIAIATNEEVRVLEIKSASCRGVGTWEIDVKTDKDERFDINVPRDWNEYQMAYANLRDDCKGGSQEWDALHEFTASFIRAQSIYAMTLHASQGSTFSFCFLDVPNVRARMHENPLEVRRLLYTGATRAAKGLVLVGV